MKSSFNLKHFYSSLYFRRLESSPATLDVYDTEGLKVENNCNNEEFTQFVKLNNLIEASMRCYYSLQILLSDTNSS